MRSGFLHWFKIFQRWLPYPSTYLSIYLPVSFDPCQVASFETIHLRAEWIYERGTRLEGGKGKKERSLPYGEKVSPSSINAGENRYRESRKRVRAVRRKIGEALPPNREERLSPRLIAFSPSARGRDTRGSRTMGNK